MAYVLSVIDYVVIAVMLAISAAIGIFFAVRAGRRQSSSDYFLGDQKMSVIPISLSLAATVISAITYLGTPAEIYKNGPGYGLILLCRLYVPFIVAFAFVPVFYRLKVITVYEYLGLRFNSTVRYAVVFARAVNDFLYMGIIVYTPALALSLAAGTSLSFSILAVGIICTFYTSIGGIKAVIWTDVFQAISMLLGAVVMIIAGTAKIGGPAEGWRRAVEGGRGDLIDFRIDPTIRFTVWSAVIGGTFHWLNIGAVTQSLVQRYNSCRTEQEAKLASWLGMIGMAVIEVLAVATGMTIFAYYYNCDPLTSGEISRSDQIVAFFIVDFFHYYPAVPGLLIGGTFCASLSSMSSVLNGLVATAGQDIIKVLCPDLLDSRYALIVKIISFLFGVLTITLAFLASVLGDVLMTTVSIAGVIGGPILGVFMLGLFYPKATSAGAIAGLVGGVIIGLIQFVGSLIYPSYRVPLPVSVDGCMTGTNTSSATITPSSPLPTLMYIEATNHQGTIVGNTSMDLPISPRLNSPAFFNLSYLYLPALTSISCILIGIFVSHIESWRSQGHAKVVDPKLLSPVVVRCLTNVNKGIDNKPEGINVTAIMEEQITSCDSV